MAVIGIGQRKGYDQFFEAYYEAVTDGFIHQGASSCEALGGQAGIVLEDIPHPFLMDGVGPPGSYESGLREPDEQVAQRGWVEDVRVVDGTIGEMLEKRLVI